MLANTLNMELKIEFYWLFWIIQLSNENNDAQSVYFQWTSVPLLRNDTDDNMLSTNLRRGKKEI